MFKIFVLLALISSCYCLDWIAWKANETELPKESVVGSFDGKDVNYIIRAKHNDGLYPGKFNPSTGKALLTVNGKEVEKETFEVLVGNNEVQWSRNPNDRRSTVRAGYSVQGHNLFICRASTRAGKIPGKLQDKNCFFSINGIETGAKNYEALKMGVYRRSSRQRGYD